MAFEVHELIDKIDQPVTIHEGGETKVVQVRIERVRYSVWCDGCETVTGFQFQSREMALEEAASNKCKCPQ